MAGRGQVSWLPGSVGRTFPRALCRPQWPAHRASGFLCPVTVAGPRRSFTGLPLTTGRIAAQSSRRPCRTFVQGLGPAGDGDLRSGRGLPQTRRRSMRKASWRPHPRFSSPCSRCSSPSAGPSTRRRRSTAASIVVKSIPGNRLKPHSVARQPAQARRPRQAVHRAADRRRHRREQPRPGAERRPRRQPPTPPGTRSTPRPRSTPSTRSTPRPSTGSAPVAGPGPRPSPAPAGRPPPSAAADGPGRGGRCARGAGRCRRRSQLAAFAGQEGVSLDKGDEWSSDVSNVIRAQRLRRRDRFDERRSRTVTASDQHPRLPLRDPARRLIEEIGPVSRRPLSAFRQDIRRGPAGPGLYSHCRCDRARPVPSCASRASLVALALIAAIALAAPSLAAAALRRPGPARSGPPQPGEVARALAYWTPARMRATPSPSTVRRRSKAAPSASFAPVTEPSVPPFTVNGRLFVRQGNEEGFCSATAINSPDPAA